MMHQMTVLLMTATPMVLSITVCKRLRARLCSPVVCCLAPWRRVWSLCVASSWVADVYEI